MIRQTLFVPLAGCLLAMACAQAIAAPTLLNFVVFGDSLNDAGHFTDTGGPAGATQRFTNRTGPTYQDGSGEVYSPTRPSCWVEGSVSLRTRLPLRPQPSRAIKACQMATTGP